MGRSAGATRRLAMTAANGEVAWDNLAGLFQGLLEVAEADRAQHLAAIEDAEVRSRLARLLAAHEHTSGLRMEELLTDGSPHPRPDSIGGYRLLSLLGEGGMGEVWLAEREQDDFPHRVALKRIRSGLNSPELRQRFALEQRALARLSHRGIALLLDGGIDDEGVPYLVLEYVEGEWITRAADERRLSVDERLELFGSVCEAVSYAHANLIVHRDLKPSNILLTEAGEIRLLDFGVVKILDPDLAPEVGLTRTAVRLATPEYASPEQLEGAPVTTATDVYALGLLLFELLCGRRPFEAAFPEGSPNLAADHVGTSAMPIAPELEPLAFIGGPTPTLIPLPTSLAIDLGTCPGDLVDQRGFSDLDGERPVDDPAVPDASDGCDIGAIERGAVNLVFADGFETGDWDRWSAVVP